MRFSFSTSVVRFSPSRSAACFLLPPVISRLLRISRRSTSPMTWSNETPLSEKESADAPADEGFSRRRSAASISVALAGDDDGALDGVFELTYVPGPAIGPESGLRGRTELLFTEPKPSADRSAEVAREEEDVVFAVREAGHVHGKNGEPVVQVGAELALLDELFEMGVCRGDEPHVDGPALRIPQPADQRLLEHAQQLRLERETHGADLVEE